MAVAEAERIYKDVPNPTDGPEAYKAKLDQVVVRLSATQRRYHASLAAPSRVEARRIRISPLSKWEDEVRAEQQAKQDEAANADAAEEDALLNDILDGKVE